MTAQSSSSFAYAPSRILAPRIYDVPRDGDGPRAAVPNSLPSAADERLHRKQQLAASLRLLARHGVEPGLAGHLSARDPEHTDHFWVNPVGVPFSHIRVSDLLRIDSDGRVVEGDGPVNISGIAYHHAVQRARPDVVGIVHAHSFHAKTWSAFGRPVEPIVADLAVFHEDQVIFVPDRPPERTEADARDEVADQFVRALGSRNILIWRNHGHWTVGNTVESAAWRFIAYESAARVQLAAQAAGTAIVDPPARAPSAEQREAWAWLSFLPYWDQVVRDEPDLFD
jgi:L-ribulose-5-phosphate 4-epimerase